MSKLVTKPLGMSFSKSMVESFVSEYSVISAQIKKLEERKKYLAGIIKDYAKRNGIKDDKGSYYCENDDFVYGLVVKSKTVPRADIISILREKGRNDCIDIVEEVNLEKINKYHDEGIITDDDILDLFEVQSLTPSISVKEKKELVTVEQKAASKKR